MERKIIASAIKSRENFQNLEKFNVIIDLGEQAKVLYDLVREYYEHDPDATSLDVDILEARVEREYPRQAEIFTQILRGLPSEDSLSVPNILDEIASQRKERLSRELSSHLLGAGSDHEILALMDEYRGVDDTIHKIQENEDVFQSRDIGELFSSIDNSNKIRLWPKSLNEATDGGALPGHNILILGRTEVGKSLFALNLAGGFLHDGYKVLFIENEDPAEVTLSRMVCRLAEMPLYEAKKNQAEVEKRIKTAGYDNFILKETSPGTFYEIQSLIERYTPDVVIINQLRNIYVGGGDSKKHEMLEKQATRARNLAKKYGIVVVNVTQAGDSATGKLVLETGDIDNSNTGMPAQMDLIIGIGVTREWEEQSARMISLPKNKLGGKHDFFRVLVDAPINKVIST